MSYDEWNAYAEVAELYNVRSEDSDEDGVIDEIILEFNMLTEGELVPNVPYLIRSATTDTVTFECSGKDMKAAPDEDGMVECSSTKEVFRLYGIYQPKSFAAAASVQGRASSLGTTTYSLIDGEFVAIEDETELPAGSIYLAVTPKGVGYAPSAAPTRVKVSVIGAEPWTGIEEIKADNTMDDNQYYDLCGRRIANSTRGLYIHNGRKIFVK